MSTYQQNLNFFQRRISALETDIQDLIVMYLQACSTKNIRLAEQCEVAILSAYKSIKAFNQTLNATQRPVRKTI
jgi:hypothetical protein